MRQFHAKGYLHLGHIFGTFRQRFFCWSLKINKKGLWREVWSQGQKKQIFGSPRTLWGVLAPARQLNSHFFVLDPPGTTCGAILGSNWSQKSPLYSFLGTSGAIWGVKSGGQNLWSGCRVALGRSLGRGGGSPPRPAMPGEGL